VAARSNWSELFQHASLDVLNLADPIGQSQLDLVQRPERFDHFHPARQQEFLYGRVCAAKAAFNITGKHYWEIGVGEHRAPIWPDGLVGSITHGAGVVAAAVGRSPQLLGVGIDLEQRGRVKDRLSRIILSSNDLSTVPEMEQEDLLALIFSAKESLYKALYPQVKTFFGFDAASLVELNSSQNSFTLELVQRIGAGFGPNERNSFSGRYYFEDDLLLTVVEVLP
jgi:enterobactin synthetase component D